MAKNDDVYLVLKNNPGTYLAATDLKKVLDMNVQTIYSALRKLSNTGDIVFKEVKHSTGPNKKMFAYIQKDDKLDLVVKEYRKNRSQERYGFFNSDVLATLMLIKEVRELKEEIENGNKK